MSNFSEVNTSRIITSLIGISYAENYLDNYIKKITELPLREIEVDLDMLEEIERYTIDENIMITSMINYPLGGYQTEYMLDSIRWAVNRKANMVCAGLPICWLRSDKISKLAHLLDNIRKISRKKPVKISIDSSLLSVEEITSICDLLTEAGISHLKTSSGLPHPTLPDDLSFIRLNYPGLLLTVDNNLQGDSPEIGNLFQLGCDYVCVKKPWLYHF